MTSTPTQIIRIAVVLGLGLAVGLIIRSGFRSNHDDHDHASHKMSGMETKVQAPPEFGFINKICPIMGNAVPDVGAVYVVYNGMAVGFCCPGCDSAFLDDPVNGLKKIIESGGNVTKEALSPEQNPTMVAAENTVCPVLGSPIEDDRDRFAFAVHNGVRVELCCPDCRVEFMKSPDTYLAKAAKTGDVPKERLKP